MNNSLIFILTMTVLVVFDSTIVKFYTYSEVELPTSFNVAIFIVLFVVFDICCLILLGSLKNKARGFSLGIPVTMRHSYKFIFGVQLTFILIILLIILQISILNKYSILLLHVGTYLSHISTLGFLAMLISMFVGWLKSKKNLVIVLYAVSLLLIATSEIVSLIYLETVFSRSLVNDIRPFPVHSFVTRFTPTHFTELLATTFDLLSLSSFLVIWVATVMLLNQYRFKLGNLKFFALTGFPLLYYLFPFEVYFGNLFSVFVLYSPITYGIIYVLIFSSTKQVGALLFSLAFWTASSVVTKNEVRNSLLVSAIGMAILFGTNEIVTLQYKIYPPFGSVTEGFMPLGSFLLLVGIFNSATNVSRDAEIRREFYKSAKSQLTLLKTIGVTQMEKELTTKFKSMNKLSSTFKTIEPVQLEKEEIKEILHDVLNELYSKTQDSPKNSAAKSRDNGLSNVD